jgi:hypothetical protein
MFGIGVITGRLAMPIIFSHRVFGGSHIVVRNGRRDVFKARMGQVKGGKKLIVSERRGCGDRAED